MTVLVLVVTHALAAVAGAVAWPKLSALVSAYSASRAVSSAQALIAKAESDAAALVAAKKLVASQPIPVATGPTGSAPAAAPTSA